MPSKTDRLKPLKDYLEKEGKASVKEMRGWLSSWSIDGGKLAKSIKSKVIKKNNFFEISYELEDYYDYVDSGVNGKKQSANAKKISLASFISLEMRILRANTLRLLRSGVGIKAYLRMQPIQ